MIKPEKQSWLRRRGMMLFLLLAYIFTTSLVIEQQQTIESQRVLIRDLFRDSVELTQLKIKQAAVKRRN